MNRQQIIAEVERLIAWGNARFKTKVAVPEVKFFKRGRAAGRAARSMRWVSFHEGMANEVKGQFRNTIIHEVAHIFCFFMHPYAKPHGKEWRGICITMGGTGERTHNYDITPFTTFKTVQRHTYSCACEGKTFRISTTIHNRISCTDKRYLCRFCNTPIVYTGKSVSIKRGEK